MADSKYPWKINDKENVFWKPIKIKGKRWDQMFPYRLLVIDITKPNKILGSSSASEEKSSKVEFTENGNVKIIQQQKSSNSWEFILPITPQQLQITDQYAINLTAEMRGVSEEHNGIKFKTISASGTTGIWPHRKTIGGSPKQLNTAASIFSGTISQSSNLLGSFNSVKQAIEGEHPQSVSEAKNPASNEETIEQTGYFQAQLMQQFIERYVEEKRKYTSKDWRLVFDIPKQNKSFIVTPENFSLKQSQQKPNEYLWSFQLKAWKRIDLKSPAPIQFGLPDSNSSNNYQKVLATLTSVRRSISGATDLVKAVRSDFQKPYNILRQTALAIKDVGGFYFTVADLPANLILDLASSIKESILIAKNSFKRGSSASLKVALSEISSLIESPFAIKGGSAEFRAGAAVNSVVSTSIANEGLSSQAVKDGALGEEAAVNSQTDPMDEIFANPDENFELFNSIPVDSLNLTQPQRDAIQKELNSVDLITIDRLREFREEIQSLILEISNSFGAGNSVVAGIYGLPTPKERVTPMSVEENEILISLTETIQVYDGLTATKIFDDNKEDNSLEFVGGLADESGIDFNITTNKFLVPVPFGSTIETISARYLKDPDRFIEIATLNNLRSPYIDEEGFYYKILSNADGRRFNVSNEDNNLYIGQKLVLFSSIVPRFVRKIISIDKISDTNYLITTDGEADLDKLKTVDGASMQGYLPGTVNSQNQIYIPTSASAAEDDRTHEISHLDEPALTKLSKVDFLLTETNDMAINSVGDFRLANGITNLIQSLKLKINTKKGSLLRHLDYGLGLKHGVSIADVNNGAIIGELNKMIEDDDRFEAIERIEITLNGSTLRIDMAVTIANGSGVVPVSFDIKQ